MTPERINAVIAEWLGDSTYEETDCRECGQEYRAVKHRDFFHDLNAVHEAEAKLENQYAYAECLLGIHAHEDFAAIHATAPQRCEALLRTLGRWEE